MPSIGLEASVSPSGVSLKRSKALKSLWESCGVKVLVRCDCTAPMCLPYAQRGQQKVPSWRKGAKPCSWPCLSITQWVSLHLCMEQHAVCFGISSSSTLRSSLHKQYHAAALAQHLIFSPFLLEGKPISQKTMVHFHMPHRKSNLNFQLFCICGSG